VEDDGAGIPADLLPNVFDLFTQGDRTLDRAQGGLGIGLTLVRRLAELHGGSAEARSGGAGLGSEFTVRLPMVEATRVVAPEAPARGPAPASPMRVLVVEDNADAADMLAELLRQQGHMAEIAGDGKTALEAVRRLCPDVALVDIGLPGMDGYEVARRVRAACPNGPPLLVAVTGYGQ